MYNIQLLNVYFYKIILNLKVIRTTNILDDYEMKEEIAKGAYASCRRGIHRLSKVEHAIKVSQVI